MSKQTAVEWLVEQITNKVGYYSEEVQQEIYQQAKAMERDEIEQSYYDGTDLNSMFTTQSEYYEQNYGKEAGHE